MIPSEVPEGKEVVIVQSAKITSAEMVKHARIAFVGQLIAEVMREVPGADFIEVRAIRYDVVDKEEGSERSAGAVPPVE